MGECRLSLPRKYLSPITFHLSPVMTRYSVCLTPVPPGSWILAPGSFD